MAEPPFDAILSTLPPHQRATVLEWAEASGADAWTDLPPLRSLLPVIAILYVMASMDEDGLSRGDRFRYAAEALGIEDDSERATHPAESHLRKLRRWVKESGQSVRPDLDRAA